MHQGTKAVVLGCQPRDDLFDQFTVGELDVGARGINQQLLRQVAGQLVLVGKQQLLVIIDVLELAAVMGLAAILDVRTAIDWSLAALKPGRSTLPRPVGAETR